MKPPARTGGRHPPGPTDLPQHVHGYDPAGIPAGLSNHKRRRAAAHQQEVPSLLGTPPVQSDGQLPDRTPAA